MRFEAELLPDDEPGWNEFLLRDDRLLLYASTDYRRLIANHIRAADDCQNPCFVVRDRDRIVGGFPLMILKTATGNIANSLPFYGSNGGPLVDADLTMENANEVRSALLDAVNRRIESENCMATTIVSNPLIPSQADWLAKNYTHTFRDERIGQITHLPQINPAEQSESADELLLNRFNDPRPRNIRKAIRSGITVRHANSDADFQFLADTHADNMRAIGGLAKPAAFFELVRQIVPATRYRLYVAEKDQLPVAALLVFFFGKTVEYYTPCTVASFRNEQPGSLLIFTAMKQAAIAGYRNWNWGGTWRSQQGVYDFKRRWGATDYPYHYFVNVADPTILGQSREAIIDAYPNFYVVPFDQLSQSPET